MLESQDCDGRSDSPDGLCTVDEILQAVVCTRDSKRTVQLPIPILDISNLGNNLSQSEAELWNPQEESLFPTLQSDDIVGLDVSEPNLNPDTPDNYMLNGHNDKEEDPLSAAFQIFQSDEIVLNAGDSVHSVIENQIKGSEIYLPSQYVQMTKMARKNPFPYDAKLMQWSDFNNYAIESTMRYPSIRPGRKPHDPVVTDLRWLHYDPDGIIRFKLNFTDEALPLPVRPRAVGSSVEFPKLHGARLRILLDKYRDLQALKTLMPSDCHAFYEELPHEENSRKQESKQAKKEKETAIQEENDVNGKPSGSKSENERKRKKEDAKKEVNLQPKRVRKSSKEKPR